MDSLRDLPSVDQVLRALERMDGLPHSVIANEVRAVLAKRRKQLLSGQVASPLSIEQEVQERVRKLVEPSLRRVINASGVILHTNLGRAPLVEFQPYSGYTNLEYDLETGERGKRDVHTAGLLERLLDRPSVIVNNNAAAVYLVLNELAAGYEVIVSRGELIEIGDGFRIPEIMIRSGGILREVGTTNRTRLDDYESAINERTRLIFRVHPSNFQIRGFTARPELKELSALGRAHNIPVYEDLGSGCLVDLRSQSVDEPVVSESFAAGAHLVSFSCDKLLGGPQAGIIAGDGHLIRSIRRNPMYRAFRVDKLAIQALETTLRNLLKENWSAIPALRMIQTSRDELQSRAQRVARALKGLDVAVREGESAIGGGSTPAQTLPTWLVEIGVENPTSMARRLRLGPTPVVVRIERQKIILDMRTVAHEEEATLIDAVRLATGN